MIARLWWLVDKRALLVTLACFGAWRLLLQIPIVLVPPTFIDVRLQVFNGSGWFAAIGPHSLPMSSYSIGVMGLGPYINALIVVSLVRVISVGVEQIAHAPGGGVRLERWTRALTIVLALGQAYGFTVLFQNDGALPSGLDWSSRLAVCLEITAGTAILLLVADVLDEHGLGFGYGALLLYALNPIGTQVHRLADSAASDPSFEALITPMLVAGIFAVALSAGTIALWMAVRRVLLEGENVIHLRVLASGVLRPPMFAISAMFLPTVVANYYTSSDALLADWIRVNWRPDGPLVWGDVLYVSVWAALVVAFAYFVTAIDLRWVHLPAEAVRALNRLLLVGGVGLALITVVAPMLEQTATTAAGRAISVSGFSVALGAVLLLVTIRRIERRREAPELAVSPTYLP